MKKNKVFIGSIIALIITLITVACYYFFGIKEKIFTSNNNELVKNLGVAITGSSIEISKEKVWEGTNNPSNYQATFTLYEAEADYVIYYIEDLIDLNKNYSNYIGKKVALARTLDFNEDSSYRDASGTTLGDLNSNGTVQTIKEELTDRNSSGCPSLGDYEFSIFFYGNGHEIRNLYMNHSSGGLFIDLKNAEIYDLTITGELYGSQSWGQPGGIGVFAQYAFESKFINCYNKANIIGGGMNGGIVGYVSDSESGDNITTFISCANYGNITNAEYAGGIVGEAQNVIIKKCYNYGDITIDSGDSNFYAYYAGGIIGDVWNNSNKIIIEECYNKADITSQNSCPVGGIIGSLQGDDNNFVIKNCYNEGNIYSNILAGGIIGQNLGTSKIYNNYNLGNVSGDTNDSSCYVGGICGINKSVMNNCYSAGIITGKQGNFGGILGKEETGSSVINCYYSNSQSTIGTEVTDEEIKTQNFTDTLNANKSAITDVEDLEVWGYTENEYPSFSIDYKTDSSTQSTALAFTVNSSKSIEGNTTIVFDNLPLEKNNKKMIYKIEETSAARKNKLGTWDTLQKDVDYKMTDINDVVTNTVVEQQASNPTRNITVKKKWRTPETEAQNYVVTLRLVAVVGQTRTVVTDENDNEITKTIRGNNGTAIFENVPVYDGEDEIKYEVEEIRVQKSKGMNEETGEEEFEDVPLDKFKATYQTI